MLGVVAIACAIAIGVVAFLGGSGDPSGGSVRSSGGRGRRSGPFGTARAWGLRPRLLGTGSARAERSRGKPFPTDRRCSRCGRPGVRTARWSLILDGGIRDHPGVGFVTLVTAVGDRPGPTPEGYMAEHGLSSPVAVDDDQGSIARALGVLVTDALLRRVRWHGQVRSLGRSRRRHTRRCDLEALLGPFQTPRSASSRRTRRLEPATLRCGQVRTVSLLAPAPIPMSYRASTRS